MNNKEKCSGIIVNTIFIIVLIICVFSLLLSFMCFSINLTSTAKSIKNVSDEIISSISEDNSENKEEKNNDENLDFNSSQRLDIQNEIDYLERLKEIESTSVSVNLLTFLYTFLSSVLIGIGTYFMKKMLKIQI